MRKTLTRVGLWGVALVVLDITLGTLILTYVDIEAFAREHAYAVLSAPFVLWGLKRLYRYLTNRPNENKQIQTMEI